MTTPSEQIGQSCSVALLDETDIVYIARAAQKRVMSIGLMPGSRLPGYCTSMGRVLLAALPREEARALVEASNLAPRTTFSMTDPERIMERIECARAEGFAIIDQEVELGLRSIAVPLIDRHGRVIAALNSGMAATHEKAELLADTYLPRLLKVQAGLRRVL